jgi:PAS domain S-box-containing protein
MKKVIKASFFQKIVLPAMLTILLFVISVFVFIIPAFENSAIEQKRIMLHELTNTAWSILQKYHLDEANGLISLAEAQEKAISEVEALRYGPDKKDYFWITDLEPAMIMHPYVHELTGKSLHDYSDPDGTKLFIEAVKIAQEQGEGFVRYKWQFKDDSTHIVPKLSFVKSFPAWDWIIGTGIYLHDVQQEISSLTNKLIMILLGISFFIGLIIFFITYQSLNIETRRRLVEEQLHESREKYRSLLESSTEGIMLLINGKISYTNAYIQNWLQYSEAELVGLHIEQMMESGQEINFSDVTTETRIEVDLINKNGKKAAAVLTALPVHFAGKEGLLLTFRDTHEHKAVKTELEGFKQRYNNIAQYGKSGLFRFSLKDKRLLDLNQIVSNLLGYDNMSELKKVPLGNILAQKSELRTLLSEVLEKGSVTNKQIGLRRKNNSIIEVRLSLFLAESGSAEHYCCDGIIETVEPAVVHEEINSFSQKLYELLVQGYQPVADFCKTIADCPHDASLQQLVGIMQRNNTDAVLLTINQKPAGIITYTDVIRRFLANGINAEAQASEFMSAPLIYIDELAPLNHAASLMDQRKISHLLLRNDKGEIKGVIDRQMLAGLCVNPAEVLKAAVENCANTSDLAQIRKNVALMTKPLLVGAANVQIAARIISAFNDAITSHIIDTAISEVGKPPVPFAFIVIGSAGREELAFNSDQDNAIIYDNSGNIPSEALQQYFVKLGEKVCKRLDESGLHKCPGNYMASNPKWCQPLSVWKNYFTDWIENAEPENILNISVFFDLRHAYGEPALFNRLEDHVFEAMKGRSAFFYFLAQSVSSFKPPLNVFGNIVTESSGKNNEVIDVKSCIAAVVMFARIYALHQGIRYKNTCGRVQALKTAQVLNHATADEVIFHYNFLSQKRLERQLQQIMQGTEITNTILPRKMPDMDQMILKKVFSQMSGYQEKLGAEFMSAFKG